MFMIDGEVVLRDGRATRVDGDQIRAKAAEAASSSSPGWKTTDETGDQMPTRQPVALYFQDAGPITGASSG